MKKLFFMSLLVLSGMVFAQPTIQPTVNPKVVTLMPNEGGQGYLVLNQKMNPKVVIWRLELMERVCGNDTTYEDKVIKTINLGNINYLKSAKIFLSIFFSGFDNF